MVTSLVDGSLSEGQSRSFYNPSTRSKLKSFEDMTHKTKLKCRSGDTVNPELVFSRELVLANCREDGTSLDGRSLSWLLNCAIFRKTLTTVPTNDFLTTCKH
jgi:hypothetical protein